MDYPFSCQTPKSTELKVASINGRLGSANLLTSVTEGIMKDKTVKSSINTALMYLAGSIHAAALCFLAFVVAYKLHIYVGFPIPSLDGLSFVLVVFTFIFKRIIEKDLEESGTSIKDALPKLAIKNCMGYSL